MKKTFPLLLLIGAMLLIHVEADAWAFKIGLGDGRVAQKRQDFKRTYRFENRGTERTARTNADFEVTYDDFATHLREGNQRTHINIKNPSGAILMDVGVIDIPGAVAQEWSLPNLTGYTKDTFYLEHVSVASTGYEGYYPEVNRAVRYAGVNEYELFTLDNTEFFIYGYTETTNGVQEVKDFYTAMSPVPLNVGESYTGYVIYTYSSDPNLDSTVYTQEYDVVGQGTFHLPNGLDVEMFKLHFRETEEDYKDDSIVATNSYDEIIWYSKEGYYIRMGVYDAWASTGEVQIDYIKYQEVDILENPTTWDGSAWSNGEPLAGANAVIEGNYNTATDGDIECADLIITGGSTLTQPSGNISVSGNFFNNGTFIQTEGTFTANGTDDQIISGVNTFRNLTIDNSGWGVMLGNTTTITGVLTLTNGSFLITEGYLVLKSDSNGTAYIVGDLIDIYGNVKVQRYVKDNSGETWSDYGGTGYRYFSSPLVSATVASFQGFTADLSKAVDYNNGVAVGTANFPNIFFYDESRIGAGQEFAKGWNVPLATTTAIPSGAGFIANITTGIAPSMTGELSYGNIDASISRGGQTSSGWNLLGNPYASPLDLGAFLSDNSGVLEQSAYIRIASSRYGGVWASYVNGVGEPSGAIDNGIMAPMQGFFVRKADAGNGTASFTESQRANDAFNTFRKKDEKQGLVRLRVQANGKSDGFVAYFQAGATSDFDAKFDAYKVQYNPAGYPTLWQPTAKGEMIQISGMNEVADNQILPVSLWAEFAGKHTFSANELKGLDGFDILLEDRTTASMIDLRKNASYQVELAKGKHEGRFFLHIVAKVTGVEDPASIGISIYGYANNIRVALPEGMAKGDVAVFDMAGRLMLNQGIGDQATLATGLAKGIYVVRVTTEAGVFAKKVYLE